MLASYDCRTKAFLGQKSEHFPHLTHLPWSIVGASKPDCDSAPTGHTFTAGHLWFCGQFSFFKVSFFSITLFSSIFVVLICGSFRSFFRTRAERICRLFRVYHVAAVLSIANASVAFPILRFDKCLNKCYNTETSARRYIFWQKQKAAKKA